LVDEGYALLALIFGVVGALGAAVHGGFDLDVFVNQPDFAAGNAASQIDPRGLLTFAVAGMAVLLWARLITSGGQMPRNLGLLGYALGVLLIIIYLAR